MAAASVTLDGTSIEVLTADNYERWKVLFENYLIKERLRDVVMEDTNSNDYDYEFRNGKALYAIQLSCAPHYFKKIRAEKDARKAWKRLSELASSNQYGKRDVDLGIGNTDLHRLVHKGDWDAVLNFKEQKGGWDAVLYYEQQRFTTILHTAVIARNEHIVEELANNVGREFLRTKDRYGYTALALVAQLNGNTQMAKCMIERERMLAEEDERMGGDPLITMKTDYGEIPVLLASAWGHAELTRYLYDATPREVLTENNYSIGTRLLLNCIKAEIFDFALELLRDMPEISTVLSDHDIKRLLKALANMPHVFQSGCRLNRWQRAIYQLLPPHNEPQAVSQGKTTPELPVAAQEITTIAAIKELYDKKVVHYRVLRIMKCLTDTVSKFNEDRLRAASAYDAVLQATKYGMVEFIESMGGVNPNLLWGIDKHKRGVFSYAILNRQEKVFKFLLERAEPQMRMIASRPDIYGNNMLHHVAELGPSSDLDSRFGPALQMQREIQWFKEVEKIAHPICKEARNANDKKPREVFTESHKELMEAGDKWAKETAQSFTIVCTLIITIAFAAAITVPGGNDQTFGFPIFLKKTLFGVFIMADAISLITSSSSVLISIVILTSRYTEKDFETRLPLTLMANLFLLFMSVVAMMIAFCTGISMMLRGYHSLVITIILLASLPIIIFVSAQVPLFFKIAKSTMELKWFISTLLLPYIVFNFILISPTLVSVYLIGKIKCCETKCCDCESASDCVGYSESASDCVGYSESASDEERG